jgi:hypothetical protein
MVAVRVGGLSTDTFQNKTKLFEMISEGKFLVMDQPHSKLITFLYLIWRYLFSRKFWSAPN